MFSEIFENDYIYKKLKKKSVKEKSENNNKDLDIQNIVPNLVKQNLIIWVRWWTGEHWIYLLRKYIFPDVIKK